MRMLVQASVFTAFASSMPATGVPYHHDVGDLTAKRLMMLGERNAFFNGYRHSNRAALSPPQEDVTCRLGERGWGWLWWRRSE